MDMSCTSAVWRRQVLTTNGSSTADSSPVKVQGAACKCTTQMQACMKKEDASGCICHAHLEAPARQQTSSSAACAGAEGCACQGPPFPGMLARASPARAPGSPLWGPRHRTQMALLLPSAAQCPCPKPATYPQAVMPSMCWQDAGLAMPHTMSTGRGTHTAWNLFGSRAGKAGV